MTRHTETSFTDLIPDNVTPHPVGHDVTFPWVLDQRPDDDGSVLVTFALPGLRRMTVRVPWATWLSGEHLHVGRPDNVAHLFPPNAVTNDATEPDE